MIEYFVEQGMPIITDKCYLFLHTAIPSVVKFIEVENRTVGVLAWEEG